MFRGSIRRNARWSAKAIALLVPLAAGLGGPAASVRGTDLQAQLDAILTRHDQPKARFGGRVIELPGGRVLYDHDGETPLIPASTLKLVVIAAAIDRLGPAYAFTTSLSARGEDLVVVGSGDPTFGDEKLAAADGKPMTHVFHEWAERLKAAGVSRVAGNLVIDDSVFDRQFVHPNWPSDQYQAWYEAPIGGLNFNANCTEVAMKPAGAGRPAHVSLVPGNTLFTLVNKTTSGGKHSATAMRPRGKDEIVVRGRVAKPNRLGPITVPDPGLYFGYVFKTVLAAKGIRLQGRVVREKVSLDSDRMPIGGHLIAAHRAPLSDAALRAGRDSLGMMAEGLIKALGAAAGGRGSWETGRQAVMDYLTSAGVSTDGIVIDDGSGLSRQNRISAASMTQALRYVFESSPTNFDALRNSLARPGREGTMKRRLRDEDIRDRIFAKTGYINGVRTLAGYVRTADGRWLAFAFLYNGAAKTRPLTKLQDEACALLARSR